MWPFSTIRDLKLELAQVDRSNTRLLANYDKANSRASAAESAAQIAYSRVQNVVTAFDNLKKQFDEVELIRQSLETTRINHQEIIDQKVRDLKQLDAVFESRSALARSLAAERDEAVLRARLVDKMLAACQNKLAEARIVLKGAMVRDPQNGRMVKWVEPCAEGASSDAMVGQRTIGREGAERLINRESPLP